MHISQALKTALAHHQSGRLAEAEAIYRQVLAVDPQQADALHLLGLIAQHVGHHDDAVELIRQAITINPQAAVFHCNLGISLDKLKRREEALVAYGRAIALKRDYPKALANMGIVLKALGRLEEAVVAYQEAIRIQPDIAETFGNLGNALKDKGEPEEAIAACRQAISLKPDFIEAHSSLVFFLNYQSCWDAQAILREHRQWAAQHAEPLRKFIEPHRNERSTARRLRVGYVSPDFETHPVAFFVEGLLANHAPAEVEVYCYADITNPDAITARLEKYAGKWRRITGMVDSRVAGLVREDGIDILVDLAGHTDRNRLLVFARKPAPVQVSWLGYPNTTGLETMDCRLTDAFADPPGTTENLHTERLIRLRGCAWCYRPPEDAPPVGAPPVLEAGRITFGCFNAMPKINGPLLELWSRILHSVPGSRLLLKNGALRDPSVQQRVRAVLEGTGIAPERVELMGHVSGMANHLAAYGRVDIALDSHPYHGTTTTCESLWMGVPVIAQAGKTHVSRVGVSLLCNVGLPELVAASQEEYVRITTELAGDLTRLAQLRSTLRERMAQSPLMDAPRFARDVESAYRQMWQAWCEK